MSVGFEATDEGPAPLTDTYAALDLGTNNCRLLVARPARVGFRVIDAFSRIVRLGEGVTLSGVLADAAMSRTIEALQVCAGKMRRRRVTQARGVATEACRRASNCGEFLDRVQRETGLKLEIISSGEEARLALGGCSPLLNRKIPFALVFDIGGGSTELTFLAVSRRGEPRPLGSISVPQGVVTLTERYGSDCIGQATYDAMVEEIETVLAPLEREFAIAGEIARGRVQMLGTSGTVTTLAGIQFGLPRYERSLVDGCTLDVGSVVSVSRRLTAMNCEARAKMPCIGAERADLVVAGCAILEAICRLWPVERIRVADRGLREGILLDLMGAGRAGANRSASRGPRH